MAVPKQKKSKRRTRHGRSHQALKKTDLVICKKCGQKKRSHTVCAGCGTYKGKSIIETSQEKKTRRDTKHRAQEKKDKGKK